MDLRINQVSAWYNTTLEEHRKNKGEFNRRFVKDGTIDLTTADPEVVKDFGRLERESEILDTLGDILTGEVSITLLPDDIQGLDEA